MKRMIKGITVMVLFVFVATGMALAGDDIAMFQKLDDKIAKAILAGDHKTIMDMYVDDVYSLPSYSPMVKGKEALAEHAKKGHEMGMKIKTFSLKVVDVFGSDHQKIVVGKYKMTVMMGSQGPMPDNGKFMTVWNKQKDGSWKIRAETWNTDNPPPGMAPPPPPAPPAKK